MEAFRNGIIRKLPKQPKLLKKFEIKTGDEEIDKEIDKTLNREGNKLLHSYGDITAISMKDFEGNFSDMSSPTHPFINSLESLENSLEIIFDNATDKNPVYASDFPAVKLYENGVKSWQRTIDKLVREKNSRWDLMKDVVRINPVFERADPMFFFNRALRDYIRKNPEKGWSINPLSSTEGMKDRGPSVNENGNFNWHTQLQKEHGDHSWSVEIKMQDEEGHRVEPITHRIYECLRFPQGEDGKINLKAMDDNKTREFIEMVEGVIQVIRKGNIPPKEVEGYVAGTMNVLSSLKNLIGSEYDRHPVGEKIESKPSSVMISVMINEIIRALRKLHLAYSVDAAARSKPDMAALYSLLFDERIKIVESKNEDTAVASDMKQVMSESGPTNLGKYSPDNPLHSWVEKFYHTHDFEHAEQLLKNFREGWNKELNQRTSIAK